MKFVLKILLGMFIFNAMIIFMSPFFTTSVAPTSGAVDVVNTYGSIAPGENFNVLSILFGDFITSGNVLDGLAGIIGVVLGFVGLGVAIFAKHYILAGACFLSATVVFLFNATKNVVFQLVGFADNWIVEGIYTLITICIGILIIYTVIDMFAPGGTTA